MLTRFSIPISDIHLHVSTVPCWATRVEVSLRARVCVCGVLHQPLQHPRYSVAEGVAQIPRHTVADGVAESRTREMAASYYLRDGPKYAYKSNTQNRRRRIRGHLGSSCLALHVHPTCLVPTTLLPAALSPWLLRTPPGFGGSAAAPPRSPSGAPPPSAS